MPKNATSAPFQNGSDAIFRGWGSLVKATVNLAGGFPQTLDTGQIDWTTVLVPNAANQSRGYELFDSDDADGDLVKYIVKLFYGSGSSAAIPSFWVQVGFATDGAGNFTGIASDLFQIPAGGSIATSYPNMICAKGGAGNAGDAKMGLFFGGNTSAHCVIGIERTRDENGLPTNEIAIRTHNGQSGGYRVQVVSPLWKYSRLGPESGNYYMNAPPPNVADRVVNGEVGLGAWFGWARGLISASDVLIPAPDIIGAPYSVIDVPVRGVDHQYIISPNANSQGFAASWGGGSAVPFLLLYED